MTVPRTMNICGIRKKSSSHGGGRALLTQPVTSSFERSDTGVILHAAHPYRGRSDWEPAWGWNVGLGVREETFPGKDLSNSELKCKQTRTFWNLKHQRRSACAHTRLFDPCSLDIQSVLQSQRVSFHVSVPFRNEAPQSQFSTFETRPRNLNLC